MNNMQTFTGWPELGVKPQAVMDTGGGEWRNRTGGNGDRDQKRKKIGRTVGAVSAGGEGVKKKCSD